jgi:putative acetyltransferase
MLTIREEHPEDISAVYEVNRLAFTGNDEAELVDILRNRGAYILSLVAEKDERVVGHIFFTPVLIGEGEKAFPAVGLGPMAVLPEYQKQGIGSRLVKTGLESLRKMHYRAVIVLGHPDFYPKFGFVPASRFGIRFMVTVQDEVFMAIELQEGALRGVSGVVHYQPEFEGV